MNTWMKGLSLGLAALSVLPAARAEAVPVTLQKTGNAWTLLRGGQPYYVNGVGGSANLAQAAAAGANSQRVWGNNGATDSVNILNLAQANGLTTTLGFWLNQTSAGYTTTYKNSVLNNAATVATAVKDHPALLFYALGNELNLGSGTTNADQQAVWEFLNTVALRIKEIDPNHPVITVIAGPSSATINRIATYAPAIDVIGVNVYAGSMSGIPSGFRNATSYTGPYIVGEWGPRGHWEVPVTSWRAPFEQTSREKSESYLSSYRDVILAESDRCVGSYVFLWGQKQERTPTWYGMFAEVRSALGLNGEAMPTVDVMESVWTGSTPANRAPVIEGLWLDGVPVTGITSANNSAWSAALTRRAGEVMQIEARVTDPDSDALTYVWEVLEEATVFGNGGSYEPRPATVTGLVTPGATPGTIALTVPKSGNYRLFCYVLDGRGKVATANLPFSSGIIDLTSPREGSGYIVGQSIPLQCTAVDSRNGVPSDLTSSVQWGYYDGNGNFVQVASGGSASVANLAAGTYMLTARVTNADGKRLARSVRVVVSANTTYEVWRTQLNLLGSSGAETDDADGDGATNLSEYAQRTEPLDPASRPAVTMAVNGTGYLTLTFQRRADTKILYTVWASSDLKDWGTKEIRRSQTSNVDLPLTVTDTVKISATTPRRFLQLRIERVP